MVDDRKIDFTIKLNNALKHYPKKGYKASLNDLDILTILNSKTNTTEKVFDLKLMFENKTNHDIIHYVLKSMDLSIYITGINDFIDKVETSLVIKPLDEDYVILAKVPKNQLQFVKDTNSMFVDISRTSYVKIQNFLFKNAEPRYDPITFEALCENLSNREIIKLLLKLSTFAKRSH